MSFLRTQEKLSWAFISGVRSTVLKNDNYGLSCVIYPRATRLEAVAASAGLGRMRLD